MLNEELNLFIAGKVYTIGAVLKSLNVYAKEHPEAYGAYMVMPTTKPMGNLQLMNNAKQLSNLSTWVANAEAGDQLMFIFIKKEDETANIGDTYLEVTASHMLRLVPEGTAIR